MKFINHKRNGNVCVCALFVCSFVCFHSVFAYLASRIHFQSNSRKSKEKPVSLILLHTFERICLRRVCVCVCQVELNRCKSTYAAQSLLFFILGAYTKRDGGDAVFFSS